MEDHPGEIMKSTCDRLSELPKPILHHILCFLPQEHAVQTCALSKSWRDIGCTRPKIDFRHDRNIWDEDVFFKRDEDKFLFVLNKTLQGYHDRGISVQDFVVEMLWFDPKFISLLEKWIPILMLNMGVKRFHLESFSNYFDIPSVIFEAKSLEELHLERCRITYPDKLLSKKLHILSLVMVDIGDEALRQIMSGCPLLERVVLYSCDSFTTIKAHYSNLKHFEYNYFRGDNHVVIDIDALSLESIRIVGGLRWLYLGKSFLHLKSVYLEYVVLDKKFFDTCSVDLCCLEDLEMHSCSVLEEFQLSSRSIKRVFFTVDGPTKAVLDLPNILCLDLHCNFFPSISLSTDSSEWRSDIHLMYSLIPNNDNEAASMFDKLHELHRALGHSRISMHVSDFTQDFAFSHEGLGERPVIESLTVEKSSFYFFLKAFFNYFFGNFRPRYLEQSVYAVSETEVYEEQPDTIDELMAQVYGPPVTVPVTIKYGGVNGLVDLLCDIFLMENERENYYWGQDLEEVSVEAREEHGKKWRPLQGANISESGLPNNVDQQIRFRLKWRG
ncbi:Unknown protein [Striga hermonthica]|uniref:F-box domain-containing protein n=1 Tax=Striga hermonthica TaxID=68872 RepID=A0A9N7NNG2_STRHE|nr:Unknown protein [Striga hermonthica]